MKGSSEKMVRNELVNKKVVRAIALGLSAVMLTTPMTAMAAEGDSVEPVEPTATPESAEVKEDSQNEEAEEAIDVAQESIAEAVESAEVEILEDVTVDPDPETEDDEITYADVAEDEKTADSELVSAEAGLIQKEAYEEKAAVDVKEFNEIKTEIDANNAEIETAGQTASDAADKAEEALEEAKAATTEAAAQAAADKAAEAVAEAEEAQASAQAAYDENVDKLQAAYAELEAAKANLDNAKAALNGVTGDDGDVEAALAAVTAAEEKAAALKAAVDEEAKNLNASKEAALKAAYENMMAQKSVSKIYKDLGKDEAPADGIGDAWLDDFSSESASGNYWTAADAYFELYLQYIYGDSWVSGKFEKKNTLDNGWAYNAQRDNTYTVVYTDENGVEKEAYYNFHTADKEGNIYIYEKVKQSGWTEEVTEEFRVEKEREVIQTVIEQVEEEVTTYEDALSIQGTDKDGNTTYTKLSDVQKDTDVVLTTGSDEEGNATSVLVKDDNSQLLDSETTQLANNQKIVEGTSSDTYTVSTIQVPASYGTKEVEKKWEDCISLYSDLEDIYDNMKEQYSEEEGYVVRIYIHHLNGEMEEIGSLEEAKKFKAEAFANGWLDRGYEVGVYQVVEDTENVTEWADQQVIVKTTTATIETTTDKKVSDQCGDRKKAEKAAKAKVKELGLAEGTYTISYKEVWDGPFDKDCKYTINYKEVTTSTQEVKSETYSATTYNMNTIATTTTEMKNVEKQVVGTEKYWDTETRVIEESKEYEYWTERKNTTRDKEVKDLIDGITAKLAKMAEKQAEAADALEAATQAKKDVEAAKEALKGLEVGTAEYEAAVAAYDEAKTEFAAAEKTLAEINEDVKEAQQDYKDAAEELGRFVDEGGSNNDGGSSNDGGSGNEGGSDAGRGTGTTPLAGPIVLTGMPVVPGVIAVNTPADADQGIVEIEDEETPLAAGIGNGDGEAIDGAGDDDDKDNTVVTIEDEETPLAAGNQADAKMSWWWLLIVALLGATGYKLYQNHQKKKEESQEV